MIRDDAKIIVTPTGVSLKEALTSEEINAINEAHIYRDYDCIPHFKLAGNPPSGKENRRTRRMLELRKRKGRVCGLCHKALDIPQDDSVTDFERGQWSVIQNVIGYIKDYSSAAQLCREAGIGYKKIKALQKDCGYSYKEEVNDFLKESRNGGTELKLEE